MTVVVDRRERWIAAFDEKSTLEQGTGTVRRQDYVVILTDDISMELLVLLFTN